MSQSAGRRIIFTADSRFAVTAAAEGKPATLAGYALVWNVLSTDRGGYKVRLLPNSAKFAAPTLAILHHDHRLMLGNTENGTLRLMPDDYGVKCEIDLPDTTTGRDVAELVAKKYVRGMSFAMVDTPQGESTTENGQTILDASGYVVDEISITPIPSFIQPSIDIKSDTRSGFADRSAQAIQLASFDFDALELGCVPLTRT